jgi:hypothetical protein
MLIVICTVALICTLVYIANDTPERRHEKAERARADREYEASMRFAAAQPARTSEQVAADIELDEARFGAEIAAARLHGWAAYADAPYDCWPHRGEPEYDADRAASNAADARLARAIERRRAAFAPGVASDEH